MHLQDSALDDFFLALSSNNKTQKPIRQKNLTTEYHSRVQHWTTIFLVLSSNNKTWKPIRQKNMTTEYHSRVQHWMTIFLVLSSNNETWEPIRQKNMTTEYHFTVCLQIWQEYSKTHKYVQCSIIKTYIGKTVIVFRRFHGLRIIFKYFC